MVKPNKSLTTHSDSDISESEYEERLPMIRTLYRCILSLHPAAFRLSFAEEMLSIFDEAAHTWGTASLFGDAITSLARQWLLRSGLWKWVAATIVALVPLFLAFGSFLPWDRPMHP